MSLCSRTCGISVPEPLSNQCAPELRGGGVSKIVFISCDVTFNNVYDLIEWCQYIQEGRIAATLDVLGQKPKASAVKKKMSSCRTEAITGFDYTVTFQDYNADNQEFKDFDFYNFIQTNYQSYQVAYITCEGLIYGFVPNNGGNSGNFINNMSIEVSHVIEEDFNGSSYWDGTITWKDKIEMKPLSIPGLINALNGACDAVDIYNPIRCVPSWEQAIGRMNGAFGAYLVPIHPDLQGPPYNYAAVPNLATISNLDFWKDYLNHYFTVVNPGMPTVYFDTDYKIILNGVKYDNKLSLVSATHDIINNTVAVILNITELACGSDPLGNNIGLGIGLDYDLNIGAGDPLPAPPDGYFQKVLYRRAGYAPPYNSADFEQLVNFDQKDFYSGVFELTVFGKNNCADFNAFYTVLEHIQNDLFMNPVVMAAHITSDGNDWNSMGVNGQTWFYNLLANYANPLIVTVASGPYRIIIPGIEKQYLLQVNMQDVGPLLTPALPSYTRGAMVARFVNTDCGLEAHIGYDIETGMSGNYWFNKGYPASYFNCIEGLYNIYYDTSTEMWDCN